MRKAASRNQNNLMNQAKTPSHGGASFPASHVRHFPRIQKWPNYIKSEKRLCLTRIRWETGTVGDGKGYSSKLSISVLWEPRDMWVGLFWDVKSQGERSWYLCLIPCLPIRFKLVRAWGGIFP